MLAANIACSQIAQEMVQKAETKKKIPHGLKNVRKRNKTPTKRLRLLPQKPTDQE